MKEDEQVYLFFNWDSPITYNNNNLFLNFIPPASYLGDTVFENSQIAGYINIKENKFHPINLKYPEINFGKEFYNVYDSYFFSNIAHDGDIIYAFKYSPTIIKYNYKTGKSNRFQIKSSVFDTIYSAKKINEIASGHDFNSPYPKYYKLQYDKFRNLYYRFVLLPEQYGNKNFMVIVADTSFNVVAEGFTYKEKQHEFMFTDDYFFDGNDCYKMKFREGTNQELISVLKRKSITKTQIKKPLTHYMKNFANIEVENYTAIFMLSNETCEYTKDFFFNLYKTNIEEYEKYDIYFFIITDDFKILSKELNHYNLSTVHYENIIIDSTYQYGAYNNYEGHSLPRFIKVRKNKIVTDTIFTNEDGGIGVQNFIINSLKEQKEMKK